MEITMADFRRICLQTYLITILVCFVAAVEYSIDNTRFSGLVDIPLNPEFAFRVQCNDTSYSGLLNGIYAQSDNNTGFVSVFPQYQHVSFQSSIYAMQSHPLFHYDSATASWLFGNNTWTYAYVYSNASYPPPFGWAVRGDPSILPLNAAAMVSISVPATGDSFLVSDTSISVQWSSCDVGVYPHLLNLSLWQNGVMLYILASNIDDSGVFQWSNGVLAGSNYMLQLSSAQVNVFSGAFSLGSTSYVTSASTLDLCRSCAGVVAAPGLSPTPTAPFNLWNAGYRHQSLYRQSILSGAGLSTGDNVTSVAVLFSSSSLNALSQFTVSVYWSVSVSEVTGVAPYLITSPYATPIFGPVEYMCGQIFSSRLTPDRMRQNQWLAFPIPNTAALGPWDGVRSLLVEIAYNNLGARSNSGSVYFQTAGYAASAFGDGTSIYPYNLGTTKDLYASMFMKLRITRSAAVGTGHAVSRCVAFKPMSVEPVPTVLRVTGSSSYDPSYGIYTAQRANGFQDANLIYRKYVTAATPSVSYSSAVWFLASQFTAGVHQWQLTPLNVLTPTYVTTVSTTAEWPQDELVRWQDFTGAQANHITVRSESILYLSFTSSSMPPIRSPRYIHPLVSQALLFIPLLPLRLFTLDLMAPNVNSKAYSQALDLSSNSVLVTVSVTATNATSAMSLPSYAVPGVWQFPLRTNASLDVSMAATKSATVYAGYTMSFQLPESPATQNLFAVRLTNREFPQSRFAFGDSIQFNVAYTPQLELVSPLVLTFAPNLTATLSYKVVYSFPGDQATVELWQLTGYNTAQTTPLPLAVNASWTLNSVIFAAVMVSPTIETFLWFSVQVCPRCDGIVEDDLCSTDGAFGQYGDLCIYSSIFRGCPAPDCSGATPSFTGYPLCTATLCLRWQSLYYAADLVAIGLQAGGQISAVGFNVWGVPGAYNGVVNARIAYSLVSPSMTVVTQTFTPTTVVYGPSTIPLASFVVSKYCNFVLTSPILWDGVSNLVIEWSQANPSQITAGGGINLRAVTSARSIFEFSNSWIIDATLSPWPFVAVSTQQPVVTVADISLTIGCSAAVGSCGSNGVCNATSSMCQCSPQHFGVYCTRYCNAATTCFGNGVCLAVDGSCLCTAPFAGASCSRYTYQPLSGYLATTFEQPLADPFNLNAAASLTVMGGGAVVSRRVQWLVLAAELAITQLQSGFTLTHIVLPLATLPIQSLPNLQLSIGLTVASNFISTPDGSLQFASNLSIVYQTTLLTLANVDLYRVTRTTQTIMIPLITAFSWDGMSNVVVEISTTSSASGTFSTAVAIGGIMSALQMNTDQRCLTTLGTIYGVPSLLTCTTIPAISFASFVAPVAVLSSISPTSGPAWGGTRVTITGVNLGRYLEDLTTSGATVSLGDLVLCESVEFQSSSSIVCVTRSIGLDSSKFNVPLLMTVRTLSSGLFASRLAYGVVAASASFSYNPTPSIGSIVPSSGEFEGGTRVNIFGQYLGRSLADIACIKIGNYSCVDVHWWSASNVDCVSTNPDALPGLLPVLLVTISGDRSVYTLQPVSFEFVKGLEVSIDSVAGNDAICVLNSTFACRSLSTAMSAYTQMFTRYVLYPGVHLAPLTGLVFAADRMRLVGVSLKGSIVDCRHHPCFNLSNGHVPVVIASLQFRSAVGGILSVSGFAYLAPVVSLGISNTVPDFQQASRAVTTLGQSIYLGASAVDLAMSGFQMLIDKCDFSQSQASDVGNAALLSLMATSNVLIRDCIFRSANATSGAGISRSLLNGVVMLSNVNNVAIVRSLFLGNVASSGAAIALSNSQGLVFLVNSAFRGNVASQLGGAAVTAVSSTIVISNCSFVGNAAMGRGGAISFSSSVAVIDLSVFDSNIVALASSNSNVEESGGGALAMEVSTVTISQSQFISNAALGGGLGGAIRSIFSMLYCSSCDFNGNSAWTGGAVSLETKSTVIFTGSTTFENNAASSPGLVPNLGGAVYAHVTESLSLFGVTARNNMADAGGAIYISNAFNSLIENSRFTQNQALQDGGALTCLDCALSLRSTTFDSNSAVNSGGAMQLFPLDFTNSISSITSSAASAVFQANGVVFVNSSASFAADFVSTAASMRILKANQTITAVNVASGKLFANTFQVELLDVFGRRLISESSSAVRCVMSSAVGLTQQSRLIGTTTVPLINGVATFDALGVITIPGGTVSIQFTSTQNDVTIKSATLPISARQCISGEYQDATLNQCILCSGAMFSTGANQQQCQPCPRFSLSSADGVTCICQNDGNRGMLANPSSPLLACVENMSVSENTTFVTLAGLLILTVMIVMALTYRYRTSRTLHAASPLFCYIVEFGCLLAVLSCLTMLMPQTTGSCVSGVWLINLGFTLSFGALFVKTYRLSKIYMYANNVELRSIAISDSQLIAAIGGLVVLDCIVLAIWTLAYPYTVHESSSVDCASSPGTIAMIVVQVIIKGSISAYGTYLTYLIRNAPSAYNESAHLALSIYCMILISIGWLGVSFGIGSAMDPLPKMRFEFFIKFIISALSVSIIFLPKLYIIIFKNDMQAVYDKLGNKSTVSASVLAKGGNSASKFNAEGLQLSAQSAANYLMSDFQAEDDAEDKRKDAAVKIVAATPAAESSSSAAGIDHIVKQLTDRLRKLETQKAKSRDALTRNTSLMKVRMDAMVEVDKSTAALQASMDSLGFEIDFVQSSSQ